MPITIVFNDQQLCTIKRKGDMTLEIHSIGVPISYLKNALDVEPDARKLLLTQEERQNQIICDELEFIVKIENAILGVLQTRKLINIKEIIENAICGECLESEKGTIRNINFSIGGIKFQTNYNQTWLYNLLSNFITRSELYKKKLKDTRMEEGIIRTARGKYISDMESLSRSDSKRKLWLANDYIFKKG